MDFSLRPWLSGNWTKVTATVISAGIAICLFGKSVQAQSDWIRSVKPFASKYYAVRTDLPAEDAAELVRHMDLACESYVRLFSKLPVRTRRPTSLDLCLFADRQDYLQTLQQVFRVDGSGSWGMCITAGRNMVLVGYRDEHSVEEMKPLLQHEGFHQFAGHLFPNLPPWANEGLAEVFERGVMVGDQLALGAVLPSDYQRLQQAVRENKIVPFSRFFTIGSSEWSQHVKDGQAQLNYLQAWSLVHFFLFADEGKHQVPFLTFLVSLNRTGDWQRSFISAFGWPDLEAMQREWLAYVEAIKVVDYQEMSHRVAFLQAGSAQLAELGIFPASLELLREELEKVNFQFPVGAADGARVLRAVDKKLYELPVTGKDTDGLQFRMMDKRGRVVTPETALAKPTIPYDIVSDPVYLTSFSIKWRRHKSRIVSETGVVALAPR